jgi:DNA-binding CsgD family transcriptional regulator
MSLERFSADMPVTEDYTVAAPQVLQGKMRCRAIYDRASVEHPVISKNMRRAAEAGEQARFLETVPTKMQITDSAVLLPLTDSGTGGAVFIQDAPVVAGMQWMYEMAWDRAIPIGGSEPPDCPLSKVQCDVLRLLAQDTPEKKIERLLGISESTVYRSTSKIMEALGVETKFAAGAAAQRRGWIEPPEERHD